MLIFAHRGLKKEHPENTIPAFVAAASLGFGIELDVRLTGDGRLVCLHNSDTEHMTGTKLVVRESAIAQLQELDVQRPGVKIPLAAGVAERVISNFPPGQKAAIHVKAEEQGPEQLRILVDMFQRHQLYEKALLFDLLFPVAEQVRSMDPRIELAVSVGEKHYAPSILTWEQAKKHPELFDAVWWDEWKIPGGEYAQERAQEIHKAGKKIYAISPELHADHGHPHAQQGYRQDWENFIAWGLEGVCTAYPRELHGLLG